MVGWGGKDKAGQRMDEETSVSQDCAADPSIYSGWENPEKRQRAGGGLTRPIRPPRGRWTPKKGTDNTQEKHGQASWWLACLPALRWLAGSALLTAPFFPILPTTTAAINRRLKIPFSKRGRFNGATSRGVESTCGSALERARDKVPNTRHPIPAAGVVCRFGVAVSAFVPFYPFSWNALRPYVILPFSTAISLAENDRRQAKNWLASSDGKGDQRVGEADKGLLLCRPSYPCSPTPCNLS